MQTTLVTAPPPGAHRAKTTVYVGGLADGVTEAVLHSVCIPFGDIKVRRCFRGGANKQEADGHDVVPACV
jgi:hypothetical protein